MSVTKEKAELISNDLEVLNRAGIHARPASEIAKTASSFKADIFFEKDSMKINAKSIMGVITLGATYKTKIHCTCEGEDENEAMNALESLFERRFEQ